MIFKIQHLHSFHPQATSDRSSGANMMLLSVRLKVMVEIIAVLHKNLAWHHSAMQSKVVLKRY